MKEYNLQQDNHEKIKVSINEYELINELKHFFKWRKNHVQRFFSLGSSDFDKFIKYLSLNN